MILERGVLGDEGRGDGRQGWQSVNGGLRGTRALGRDQRGLEREVG